MKTRQNFVSNSSSCSFVVAINSTYPVKDFAKDLGKACTNSKSEYHDKELANRNRRILDFCLNTYQLLFLGSINETAVRVIVDNDTMRYDFSRFHYNDGDKDQYDEKPDQVKHRVKEILTWAKRSCDPKCEGRQSDCYAITMDTILNTRNLIKSGVKVNLDKWEDIDDLERRLKAGEQLFRIRIAHSGDGYGSYYIYCEDNANGIDHLAAEILTSESM